MAETMEDVEPLVTRCPECGTRFRVSEAQLQMAGGRVRCGSCLTVFFGTDHLQWDLEQAAATSDPTETLDALLREIDVFEATDDARSKDDLIPPESFDDEVEERGLEARAEDDSKSESAESVIAFDLPVDELEPPQTLTVDQTDSTELISIDLADPPLQADGMASDSVPAPVEPPLEDILPAPMVVETSPVAVTEDRFVRLWEEPTEEISEELELELESEAAAPASNDAVTAGVDEEEELGVSAARMGRRRQRLSRRPAPALPEDVESGEATPAARVEVALAEIVEPAIQVEASTPGKTRRWVRWVAVPMALSLLGAQVAWYFFPSWSADPEMRWLPVQICEVTGCELAPLKALDQLLITDVVLRGHPETTSLRVVNVLLVNTASFDQAFPEVEIAFRAPTGDLVAWKRVAPSEYLSPELRARPIIPAKTPVRIELEIEDPGTQSYGYEISLK